jgi:hypothetical protein
MQKSTRIITMKKLILPVALTALLSACSSTDTFTSEETTANKIDRPLYLRGDFSLWESQPEYQLVAVSKDIYQTKVKFTAVGKAYEFKIADETWSAGLNCGYNNEDLDKFLELGIPVQANCNSVYNYFSFSPYEAGWYQVSINFRNLEKPLVTINQIFE